MRTNVASGSVAAQRMGLGLLAYLHADGHRQHRVLLEVEDVHQVVQGPSADSKSHMPGNCEVRSWMVDEKVEMWAFRLEDSPSGNSFQVLA